MSRRPSLVLLVVGIPLTIGLAVDLGAFVLSDGVTLWGANDRGNDEFYRYWTVRLPLLVLGATAWWLGWRGRGKGVSSRRGLRGD